MKYIECIHCQKRYPASHKMEAAALRKKVRCTECGGSFPIVIYEIKPKQAEELSPEDEA